MVSNNVTQRLLSKRAVDLLESNALRIQAAVSAARLWEEVLTEAERRRLNDDLESVWYRLGTAGIWKELRGVSTARAVVDVAAELGFLDAPTVRWLLRELGEVSDDPEEAIEAARNRTALVLVERPRAAYWQGRPIEVAWESHPALWQYFWELCWHAKAGRPLDRLELGESADLGSIAKKKSRLLGKAGFPVDLGDLIQPAGRGTHMLELPPQQIRMFEVVGVERLREWTP
jgi:hypothetical protein